MTILSPLSPVRLLTSRAGADTSGESAARRWARMALVCCVAIHVWLVSAGTFSYWPQYTARYDLLARGFAAGHLHLLVKPDARLLALPDPYDPQANAALSTEAGRARFMPARRQALFSTGARFLRCCWCRCMPSSVGK